MNPGPNENPILLRTAGKMPATAAADRLADMAIQTEKHEDHRLSLDSAMMKRSLQAFNTVDLFRSLDCDGYKSVNFPEIKWCQKESQEEDNTAPPKRVTSQDRNQRLPAVTTTGDLTIDWGMHER